MNSVSISIWARLYFNIMFLLQNSAQTFSMCRVKMIVNISPCTLSASCSYYISPTEGCICRVHWKCQATGKWSSQGKKHFTGRLEFCLRILDFMIFANEGCNQVYSCKILYNCIPHTSYLAVPIAVYISLL